jgi:hypothetical protein
MPGQKRGVIILSVMGCVWCVATAFTLPSAMRSVTIAAALLVTGLLLLAIRSRAFATPGKFDRKIFRLSVVFETIVIFAAIFLLNYFHAAPFILSAIAIIVGLHFIGMWRATDKRMYLGIAAAMCLAGLVAAGLPPPLRFQVSGFGSALSLWIGAFWQVRHDA